LKIAIAADFSGLLHVRLQNSSSKIYEAALTAQVWILCFLENDAAVLRRGSMMLTNWSRGWLTCNMGCSRQSLMKLAPVNDVNVCERVLAEMDVCW